MKIGPGGTPGEVKKLHLEPRWPKMLPRVVLKRPWRPLRASWEAQEGAKRGQNRSWAGVSSSLKRYAYNKLFLNAFLFYFGHPWGSKNEHFVWDGLQK